MNCGFAKTCITPPLGFPIAGGYNPKYADGLIDDLFVRALAFSSETEKVLIISVEVCYMSNEINDECRTRISQSCGIARDAIIISCSHTHSGPLVGPNSWKSDIPTEWYEKELVSKICSVAESALADVHPARLYSELGEAEDVSFIRRYKMKDGSVVTNPGIGSLEIDHPLGEPLSRVGFLKIVREGAKDVCLVNFGTHSCTVGWAGISADYPGIVCSALEGALGDVDCMFLLSVAGDTNHVNVYPSEEEARLLQVDRENRGATRMRAKRIGYAIAGEVLKICMLAKEINSDGIAFGMHDISVPANKDDGSYEDAMKIVEIHKAGRMHELPYENMALNTVIANAYRVVRMREYPDLLPYKVFAIRVGDFFLAGLPGEPFTEIGRRIFDASSYPCTMISTITNGMSTYFPTSSALREGGYEAVTSSIGIGGDDVIVENVTALMEELKNLCRGG